MLHSTDSDEYFELNDVNKKRYKIQLEIAEAFRDLVHYVKISGTPQDIIKTIVGSSPTGFIWTPRRAKFLNKIKAMEY